jgi:hypothetical protein
MTNTEQHPWLATNEAFYASVKAVQIPLFKLPQLANGVRAQELEAEAFCILWECGSRFTIPRSPSHLGSMWTWPEDDRERCAVRTVGYALCNWLRNRHHTPSVALANLEAA